MVKILNVSGEKKKYKFRVKQRLTFQLIPGKERRETVLQGDHRPPEPAARHKHKQRCVSEASETLENTLHISLGGPTNEGLVISYTPAVLSRLGSTVRLSVRPCGWGTHLLRYSMTKEIQPWGA